jgi:hypothetical protein
MRWAGAAGGYVGHLYLTFGGRDAFRHKTGIVGGRPTGQLLDAPRCPAFVCRGNPEPGLVTQVAAPARHRPRHPTDTSDIAQLRSNGTRAGDPRCGADLRFVCATGVWGTEAIRLVPGRAAGKRVLGIGGV